MIGATNFPELLDKALVRPGRFDHHIHVPLPDLKGRRDILKVHLQKVRAEPSVDLMRIARGTAGFSGDSVCRIGLLYRSLMRGANQARISQIL